MKQSEVDTTFSKHKPAWAVWELPSVRLGEGRDVCNERREPHDRGGHKRAAEICLQQQVETLFSLVCGPRLVKFVVGFEWLRIIL
ncbi:hypothetical protein INR49_024776 [Caranx melampygus]|nr:hypothetical protein INR49_024776 [Caranx melampygus]